MEKFNQTKYQNEWNKENMLQVKASYKKEFVEDFKQAISWLNESQSNVIKKAMQDTIVKAKTMMLEDVDRLKESIILQKERCDKTASKEEDNQVYIDASIRYGNFLLEIDKQLKRAEQERLNVYVIDSCVYITDGHMMGNGIAQYISKGIESTTYKIVVPRSGIEVTVELQENPVYIENENYRDYEDSEVGYNY